MSRDPTDRRVAAMTAALMTAGAVAFATAAGPATAQSSAIEGTVTFEGSAAIPEGRLHVYLEDPAVPESAKRRLAETRLESDGKARTLAFTLPRPAGPTPSTAERIVARLERSDGWLLARGSAPVGTGAAVAVRLNIVSY